MLYETMENVIGQDTAFQGKMIDDESFFADDLCRVITVDGAHVRFVNNIYDIYFLKNG